MQKQKKIIEELQSIELFAEQLLEKCYSVREQLLSSGGFNPRATIKKKSQSKINQVIANRNKAMRKIKKILLVILFFSTGTSAQDFKLPTFDSLCGCLDLYFNALTFVESAEFKEKRKGRWLNYIPSPGYSPFTGGFTFSLNLTAPIQEAKTRRQTTLKVQSISRTNDLQKDLLKQQAKANLNALQNSIFEVSAMDSLEYLKEKAFILVSTQYDRNEITPSEFISRQIDYLNYKISRMTQINAIKQKIFELLIKYKCPVP